MLPVRTSVNTKFQGSAEDLKVTSSIMNSLPTLAEVGEWLRSDDEFVLWSIGCGCAARSLLQARIKTVPQDQISAILRRYCARLTAEGVVWSPVLESWAEGGLLNDHLMNQISSWWATHPAIASQGHALSDWESLLPFQSKPFKLLVGKYLPPQWIDSKRWTQWLGDSQLSVSLLENLRTHPISTEKEYDSVLRLLTPQSQREKPLSFDAWDIMTHQWRATGGVTYADCQDSLQRYNILREHVESKGLPVAVRILFEKQVRAAEETLLLSKAKQVNFPRLGVLLVLSDPFISEETVLGGARMLFARGETDLSTFFAHPAVTRAGRLSLVRLFAPEQQESVIVAYLLKKDGDTRVVDDALWMMQNLPASSTTRRPLLSAIASHPASSLSHIRHLLPFLPTTPGLADEIGKRQRWKKEPEVQAALSDLPPNAPDRISLLMREYRTDPARVVPLLAEIKPSIVFRRFNANPEDIRPFITRRVMTILLTTDIPTDPVRRTTKQLWLQDQWKVIHESSRQSSMSLGDSLLNSEDPSHGGPSLPTKTPRASRRR